MSTNYNPPLSPTTQYVYDKERRLKEITFPSGKKIKNIYTDVLLSQVQTPEGNIDYSYLPSGQLSSIFKNSESLTLSYDGSLLKTLSLAGTLNQAFSFSYNSDLKIAGVNYAGAANNFGYDNDGLLTSSGRFMISRNAQNGLPTSVTGGALNLGRTFDGYAQLISQTQTVNSAAASSWTLTYNNDGQIATKSETVAGITSTYVYTYDSLGRLTKVEKDGIIVEEYQYAASGTRSYETNSLRGIGGRSLTYNAEDQLLSVGSATYQYDADGFLARKVDAGLTTTYDYSSRGELLKVSLPGAQIVEYVYDPYGRRIAKKVNSVIVEKYLWAGLTQLLAVYDGSDNLLMRFEYSDSRTPNAMVKAGATYYLAYDQVGSLRAVHDATGTLIKRIDYDSFGNVLADTNPAFPLPFGFAGGLDDRDTGLVHFGFRDYDPATGRWTAKDPIGFTGGDVDLYGYVESDPINFVDPTGELKIPFTDINIDAGERYGQDALNYWANLGAQTDNPFAGGFYNVMGGLAALWTPCTSDATAGVLSIGLGAGRYLGRPYYQYYPAGNPGYSSPYLTRGWGWKTPYHVGKKAVDKLSLPAYNPGTAVRQIKVNPFQYLKGPGRVAPANGGNGGGIEYLIK